MAPSQSVWSRIRGMVKRITSRRRTKSSTTEQPAALPNKASSPEEPQAASQQPNKPQGQSEVRAATTMPTLQIALQNQTSSSQVYAYISKIRGIREKKCSLLTSRSGPGHRQQQRSIFIVRRCQDSLLSTVAIIDGSATGPGCVDPTRRTRKYRHCNDSTNRWWPHLVLCGQTTAVLCQPRPRPRRAFDLQPIRP